MNSQTSAPDFSAFLDTAIDQRIAPIRDQLETLIKEIKTIIPRPENIPDTEWVMVSTAAKSVGRSTSWIYKMERLGKLKPQEGSNGTKLYLLADLRALCEKPKPLGIPAAKRSNYKKR